MLFVEVVAEIVLRHVRDFRAPHVFADGDEFHLRRDDARAGVSELRDDLARLRAERTTAVAGESGKFDEAILLRFARVFGVLTGEITVVLRFHFATVNFFHVATRTNPVCPQRGQPHLGSSRKIRIAPRPGAIIDAHRRVWRDRAGVRLGIGDGDFTHRHANVRMNCPSHENFLGGG